MRTYTQKRTAKDPEAYVRKLLAANMDVIASARIVSIDGVTPSGQKRYTLEITMSDRFSR